MEFVQHGNAAVLQEALQGDKPVLVDFYADWCMPCKQLAPIVEELAEAFDKRVTVLKINVDDERDLAIQYGIQSIPALFLFKDGDKCRDFIGVRPYEELESALLSVL